MQLCYLFSYVRGRVKMNLHPCTPAPCCTPACLTGQFGVCSDLTAAWSGLYGAAIQMPHDRTHFMHTVRIAIALTMTAALVAFLITYLVGGRAAADPPHEATGADGTHNCDDFTSPEQAQAYFEQTGGNNGPEEDLDRDDNGRACGYRGPVPINTPSEPPSDEPTPAVRIDTGGGYCASHSC